MSHERDIVLFSFDDFSSVVCVIELIELCEVEKFKLWLNIKPGSNVSCGLIAWVACTRNAEEAEEVAQVLPGNCQCDFHVGHTTSRS